LAVCKFGQGNSILLWKDKWAAKTLQETWPHLFYFAKNDSITLKATLGMHDLANLFHFPALKWMWEGCCQQKT
jgi:hypothetical protein